MGLNIGITNDYLLNSSNVPNDLQKYVLWAKARQGGSPGLKPTLDLDFATNKSLVDNVSGQNLVTFTRASSGTYVGSDGLIKSAAVNEARFDHNPTTLESLGLLVEEARTNKTTYSAYKYDGLTNVIPNASLAPDGTFTAAAFQPPANSNAGGTHEIYGVFPNVGTISVGDTVTVYAKMKPGSALKFLILRLHTNAWFNYYNLETGQVTVNDPTMPGSMTSIGGGWWRCQLRNNSSAGATNILRTSVSTVASLANQTNGDPIYLWGVQNEAGSFPTSYIPTPATFTGRSSTATFYDANGVIQTAGNGVARSNAFLPDSNGVMRPVGLLLEAAGTNYILSSNPANTANWSPASTFTANSTTAPDGTSINSLSNNPRSSNVEIGAVVKTLSFFVKSDTATTGSFQTVGGGWGSDGGTYAFNLTAQTFSGGTVQPVGNGWYRLSRTFTTASSGTLGNIFNCTGLFLWGVQFEAGSFPTSYIPTTTATVTRAADTSTSATVTRSADVASITGTNFSSWYRQDEGTVFTSVRRYALSTFGYYYSFNDGTISNTITSYQNSPFTVFFTRSVAGGQDQIALETAPVDIKSAFGYKPSNSTAFLNGSSAGNITEASPVLNVANLRIGADYAGNSLANGTIRRLTYWPTRLPNATLQQITQ